MEKPNSACMTAIETMWLIIGSGWVMMELLMTQQSRRRRLKLHALINDSDKLIWRQTSLILASAFVFKHYEWVPIGLSQHHEFYAGALLVLSGIGFRYYTIKYLGHFFSTRLHIQHRHRLLTRGPYSWVRHPSYSGLLCGFLGMGIAMGDWLALFALMLPLTYMLLRRIETEERLLTRHFGQDYLHYKQSTKKLVPLIY